MGVLVQPKAFLVGYSSVDVDGLRAYLEYTGQEDFYGTFAAAVNDGLSEGEALCSMYAKLCYKSLVRGKNANVTRTRDIRANLEGCYDQGHGSVFEHVTLNFVITDCSRVFTHELVRHRIGTAFSQTSGRYCRLDQINLVWDLILDGCEDLAFALLEQIEHTVYLMECRKGLRVPSPEFPLAAPADHLDRHAMQRHLAEAERAHPSNEEDWWAVRDQMRWVPNERLDFDFKKKVTSAIRRIAPNGQANEIGLSVNFRALRHLIQTRTARFAEREIRLVFNQIYDLVKPKFPTLFHKARVKEFDGLREISGMKMQPYDIEAGDARALEFYTVDALQAEVLRRQAA